MVSLITLVFLYERKYKNKHLMNFKEVSVDDRNLIVRLLSAVRINKSL